MPRAFFLVYRKDERFGNDLTLDDPFKWLVKNRGVYPESFLAVERWMEINVAQGEWNYWDSMVGIDVDEKRIDDLKAFFKGKDEEITKETLKAFLGEYPEFLKKVVSVRVGGDDDGDTQKPPTDYEELKERLDKRFNIKR